MSGGESWAIMPRNLEDNPCLYSPGIKWDVAPGGFTHMTELFGPVLAVMPYRNLNEAIQLVHQTGYGLTSGLESLDDREQVQWSNRLRAGNLYINRPTTGAIVLRQPFGGLGKSAFGPGIKAGGPNYVVPLLNHPTIADLAALNGTFGKPPTELEQTLREPLHELWQRLRNAPDPCALGVRNRLSAEQWSALSQMIVDFDRFGAEEIAREHDTLRLIGQDNIRRYLPLTHMRIRVTADDQAVDIMARIVAARAAGGRAVVSATAGVHAELLHQLVELTDGWGASIEFLEESDEQLIQEIARHQVDRLRYASPRAVSHAVRAAANEAFVAIADSPVAALGRVELLWYVREQSLCVDYHRYGNLGARSGEPRTEPL